MSCQYGRGQDTTLTLHLNQLLHLSLHTRLQGGSRDELPLKEGAGYNCHSATQVSNPAGCLRGWEGGCDELQVSEDPARQVLDSH